MRAFGFRYEPQLKGEASLLVGLIEADQNLVALCHQAMDDAKQAGQCASDDIQILNEPSGCNKPGGVLTALGTANAGKLFFRQQMQAIIGSRCVQEAIEIGRLSYFWKIPMMNRVGRTAQLYRRFLFPTNIFVTDTSVVGLYLAITQYLTLLNLTQLVLVGRLQKDDEDPSLICSIQRLMLPRKPPPQGNGDWNPSWECQLPTIFNRDPSQKPMFNITQLILFDESSGSSMAQAYSKLQTPIKTIILAVDGVKRLDAVLQSLGVGSMNGPYTILLVCAVPRDACLANSQDLSAVKSAIYSDTVVVLSPDSGSFQVQNSLFAKQYGAAQTNPYTTSRYMDFMSTYQACYGFCVATKATSQPSWMSGGATNPAFVGNVRGSSFSNNYGTVQFDQASVQLFNFSFQWLPSSDGNFSTIYLAQSVPDSSCSSPTACFSVVLNSSTVSPNDPWISLLTSNLTLCDYASSQCWTYYAPYIAGGVVVFLVFIGILTYAYIRHRRNVEIYQEHWKIPRQQIKVIENKASKSKPGAGAVVTMDEVGKAGAWSKRRVLREYALIGNTKSEFIALRQLKKINWEKEDLLLIHELKKQSHDNLCAFLGISYNHPEGNTFYLCHSLVERGTLEDYINDLDFQLDKTFRSAFLRDILKGITFLHKSSIGYHGLLNMQTILIDSNWVLKLTNFGIVNMLNKAICKEQLRMIEIVPMQTYLTVAPENLSDIVYGYMYPHGTPIGDIYSFGMVLFHIVYRLAPFDRIPLSPREILDEIRRRNLKPTVDEVVPEEEPLVEIMELCWHRNIELRPRLRQIGECIQRVFKSSQGNLIDQMRRMNEKHALNLEKLVAERTEQLAHARENTERLLHEMLPKSIAKDLKERKTVEPRSYESVTVMFCQIVDFANVLRIYMPDQVIEFLNTVFSNFDNILRQYDAYKVETTGETYMVASGVPNENGDRHVFEISELALEMRDSSHHFREWAGAEFADWDLKLKIGYHCGPIAAGVIGIKAPRYCLFGDTVNFASRMQSTCAPDQIQMAESTAMLIMDIGKYKLTKRGIVKVKGKGEVNTYWLNEVIHQDAMPSTSSLEARRHSLENKARSIMAAVSKISLTPSGRFPRSPSNIHQERSPSDLAAAATTPPPSRRKYPVTPKASINNSSTSMFFGIGTFDSSSTSLKIPSPKSQQQEFLAGPSGNTPRLSKTEENKLDASFEDASIGKIDHRDDLLMKSPQGTKLLDIPEDQSSINKWRQENTATVSRISIELNKSGMATAGSGNGTSGEWHGQDIRSHVVLDHRPSTSAGLPAAVEGSSSLLLPPHPMDLLNAASTSKTTSNTRDRTIVTASLSVPGGDPIGSEGLRNRRRSVPSSEFIAAAIATAVAPGNGNNDAGVPLLHKQSGKKQKSFSTKGKGSRTSSLGMLFSFESKSNAGEKEDGKRPKLSRIESASASESSGGGKGGSTPPENTKKAKDSSMLQPNKKQKRKKR